MAGIENLESPQRGYQEDSLLDSWRRKESIEYSEYRKKESMTSENLYRLSSRTGA